jgi:amino acid transporter
VLALLLAGPACALGSAIYLDAWLERVGMPAAHPALVISVATVLVVAASAWLCYREVKLSARLLLAIEFATVGVILILFCVVLAKAPGGIIDSRQLHFGGMHISSILEAGGFAVFALAGFENVVTLGREARNPRRAIGLAMTGSIVGLGLLAKVHATQRTPVAAVTALAVLYLILGVAGAAITNPDNSYGYLGTLSGYLLVLAYGLTTLVAGVYAARTRSLRAGIALTTLVALAGIVLVYWFSFHPFPQGAYGVVAWCFVGCVVAAVVTYAILRLGWPAALARIGRTDRAAQADEQREISPTVPSQVGLAQGR